MSENKGGGKRVDPGRTNLSRPRDQSGAPNTPGDHRDDLTRLEALRERLEGVLSDPDTSPRDLASLSREYRLLVAQLAEMSPSGRHSALDEIAARRSRRGAS